MKPSSRSPHEDELPRNVAKNVELGMGTKREIEPLTVEKGADALMIMEVLGPSSIRVTMDIYTFVRLDSQHSAFDPRRRRPARHQRRRHR